ncbi:hypothetical protein HK104_000361 [Borealophlyctis nickersoniae]|nr:hypothetical protein HK104_000361 [Borealophlyctis nickersoniae]
MSTAPAPLLHVYHSGSLENGHWQLIIPDDDYIALTHGQRAFLESQGVRPHTVNTDMGVGRGSSLQPRQPSPPPQAPAIQDNRIARSTPVGSASHRKAQPPEFANSSKGSSSKGGASKGAPVKQKKIRDARLRIRERHPDWHQKGVMEELGRQWKEISDEVKKEYHDRALRLREEYKHAVSIYQNCGPGGTLDDPDEGDGDATDDLAVGDNYSIIDHTGRKRILTRRAIAVESEESDAGGECEGPTLAIRTTGAMRVSTELQPLASEQEPDTPVAQTTRKTKRRGESTSRKKLRISRSPTPILDKPNMDCRSFTKPVTSTPSQIRDGTGGGDGDSREPLGREKTPVITTKADDMTPCSQETPSHAGPSSTDPARTPTPAEQLASDYAHAQALSTQFAAESTPIDAVSATPSPPKKRAGTALKTPGRKRIAKAHPKGGSLSGSRGKAAAPKPPSNYATAEPTVPLQEEIAPSLQPQTSGPADSVGIPSNIVVTSTQPPSVEEEPNVTLRSSSPMRSGAEVLGKHKKQKNPCQCNVIDTAKDIPIHFQSTAKECLLRGKSDGDRNELRRLIWEKVTGRPIKRRNTGASRKDSSLAENPIVDHNQVIHKTPSNTVGEREKKSSKFACLLPR